MLYKEIRQMKVKIQTFKKAANLNIASSNIQSICSEGILLYLQEDLGDVKLGVEGKCGKRERERSDTRLVRKCAVLQSGKT